jgi:tetratricopeptide (TPR) repeat protein
VGREKELGQLTDALREAMAGHGSAWLVGGESGVGKSRLLEELRSLALVEGALVLRGQAVSEGSSPYNVWRQAVRLPALLTELNDLEAGVLKPLVPDLSDLLGREVPDAPEIDPQATQDRLMTVIEDLFHRQPQPTVILLEDLHWAQAGLTVLARLVRSVAESRLLIVGSYRDDDRADLPSMLPGMQVLKLKRLGREAVAELSEAMLGDAGRESRVVDWLQRQTEGNPFFLVEVVRTLAEETGQLADIGSATLPARIEAEGVQEVIQHRLTRVPQGARRLLQMAAVLGRQLDLNLLHSIEPDADLGTWLSALADVAVLENRAGHWRFTHDMMREGVLDELAEEAKPDLHRRAAEAIEAAYPDSVDQVAALAHHWVNAEETEKAIDYLEKAGEQALQSFSNEVASALFGQALALDDRAESQVDAVRRARWEFQLGGAYVNLARYAEGKVHLESGLALLGCPVPVGVLARVMGVLQQILRQVLHRIWPQRYVGALSNDQRLLLLTTLDVYEKLAEVYYGLRSSAELVLYAVFHRLNSAEATDVGPKMVVGYVIAGGLFGLIPLHRVSRTYISRALSSAESVDDLAMRETVAATAGFYYAGVGEWEKASHLLCQAINVSGELRDQRVWYLCTCNLMAMSFLKGEFTSSMELAESIYLSSRNYGRRDIEVRGLLGMAGCHIRLGQMDEADRVLDMLTEVAARGDAADDHKREILGLRAVLLLHQGQYQTASEVADQVLTASQSARPVYFGFLWGYIGAAEVCLELWHDGITDAQTTERASRACKVLHRYAHVFPVGRVPELLWRGRYHWQSGRAARAYRMWRASLELAKQLGMAYDLGLAHCEIGRHLPTNRAERQVHLTSAVDIFTKVGAIDALQRIRQDLEGRSFRRPN